MQPEFTEAALVEAYELAKRAGIAVPHVGDLPGLARLIALIREQQWIPVSERLPEVGREVAAYARLGYSFVAEVHPTLGWWDVRRDRVATPPTHWLPLPPPPIRAAAPDQPGAPTDGR
jgi:hypothetical protein